MTPASGPDGEPRAPSELSRLRAENARLWEEVHRLRAERREVEYHERLTAQLTSSASWRVTQPLRAGKTLGAWLRRRVAERRQERRPGS